MADVSPLIPLAEAHGWVPFLAELIAKDHAKVCKEGRDAVEQMLRSEGTVPGFNKPFKAPPPYLKAGLREAATRSSFATKLLLLTWRELRGELFDSLDDLLLTWDQEDPKEIEERNRQVLEKHPELDPIEMDLLAEYMKLRDEEVIQEAEKQGIFDGNGEEAELVNNGDENHPARFVTWLSELEELPATDNGWFHLGWFLEELRRLRDRKISEQHAIRRAPARNLLEELRGLDSVLKSLFLDISDWSEDNCPVTEINRIVGQLTEFTASLREHAEVEGQVPTSLAEKRAQQQRLLDIENRMEKEYDHLVPILTLQQGLEPPQDGTGGAKPHEETSTPVGQGDGEVGAPSTAGTGIGAPEVEETHPTEERFSDVTQSTSEEAGVSTVVEQDKLAPAGDSETKSKPVDQDTVPTDEEVAVVVPAAESPNLPAGEEGAEGVKPARAEPAAVLPSSEASTTQADTTTENIDDGETSVAQPTAARPVDETSSTNPIWWMLESDDIAGAYWLAHSQGDASTIPDWLLSAVAGSRWLARGASRVEEDLLSLVQSHSLDPNRPLEHSLAIAAALFPAVVFPGSGAIEWLTGPQPSLTAIKPILELVQEFAQAGLPLRTEDVLESQSREALDKETKAIAERCGDWLEKASGRKFQYAPAGDVFQHMCTKTGVLTSVLGIAAEDRRQETDRLSSELARLRNRDARIEMVREAERAVRRPTRLREIEGRGFDQLLGTVEEGLTLATEWRDAAARWKVMVERNEWWQEHVRRLVGGINEHGEAARCALRAARETGSDPTLRAPAACLSRAVEDLEAQIKGLPVSGNLPPFAHQGLSAGLAFHLLRHPGLPLVADDAGNPHLPDSAIPDLAARLAADSSEPLSIAEAVRGWCDFQDFRWVSELLAEVNDDVARTELTEYVETARENARKRLLDNLGQTRVHLEQAHLEGTIDQDTKSRIESELEEVQEKAGQEKVHLGEQASTLIAVTRDIDDSRDKVLNERRARWDELRPRAVKVLEPAEVQRLDDMVKGALARRYIYLVDELLPKVETVLESGRGEEMAALLTPSEGSERTPRDAFGRYLKERDRLTKLLSIPQFHLGELEKLIRRKDAPDELGLANLPETRRQEVAEALAAWRHLKGIESPERATDTSLPVFALLRYLGLRMKPDTKEALRRTNSGRNWLRWTISLLGDPTSPVPQFGSMLGSSLSVLCLWELPGVSIVETITKETKLDKLPCLIIYLGRLTSKRWEEMARNAYKTGRQALVLDETLLLFLAREYESRLQPFLQCTLPATDVNPYVPNAAGNVPKEMFVGRVEPLRRLREPLGPAIVYGGRQLGKSSLLKQLQRDFHDPAADHYALLEDIRRIGGPMERPEKVWERIARGLKEVDLIRKQPPTRPDRVEEELRNIMRQPQRRLLLLLDEADAFLTEDARDGFPVLNRLKEVMDSTERRFKVIFAGLHNVRRFSSIPNQPLAHLGTPVVVGPLDPRNAQELVRRPMEALGFQFRDDGVVLSILSLTNYHPGLIQLFCDQLIRYLRNQRQVLPPYRICEEDVQAVYRDPSLRQEIKERFVWTINLDTHYGVLVRSVILDQLEHRDGFSLTYSLQDLRQLGQYWWKNGFENLSADHMRDYVQELTELWTLAPAEQGRYRLRSPNLVRLLGPSDEIESYLLSVSESGQADDPWHDQDLLHPRVKDKPLTYSPLSLGQLRRIGVGPSGVTLLFGSRATGLDLMPLALDGAAAAGGGTRFQHMSLMSINDSPSIPDALRRCMRQAPNSSLVVSGPARYGRGPLAAQVRAALEFCESLPPSRDRWVRIVLRVVPDDLPEWLGIEPAERLDLETRCGAMVLRRWSEAAVGHWLEEHDLPRTTATDRKVVEVTGGFQCLLEAMIASYVGQRGRNATAMAEQYQLLLTDPRSEPSQQLRSALGVAPGGEYERLLQGLCSIVGSSESESGEALAELAAGTLQTSKERVDLGLLALERLGIIDYTGDRLRIESVARRALVAQ